MVSQISERVMVVLDLVSMTGGRLQGSEQPCSPCLRCLQHPDWLVTEQQQDLMVPAG